MSSSEDIVVCPLARHISVALPDILEVLRGRLPSDQIEDYKIFASLLEAFIEVQYLDLRRRIKWSFLLFSRGAMGKEYISRLGRPLPSNADFAIREAQFISDFLTLMENAHYDPVTKDLWEIALKEEFLLTMPVEVDMKVMDKMMLETFWKGRMEERERLPEIADQILIFYRGVSLSKKQDRFITEKINLFLNYLLMEPISRLLAKKEVESAPTKAPAAVEKESDVAKRITLRSKLPGWRSVVQDFLTKMEIVEPTLDDVVILYRKAKGALLSSTAKTKSNELQAKHNIVIKTFNSVPLADLEVIFPEKTVSLSTLSKMTLWGTLIAALFTAIMTIWQTDIDEAVIISAFTLLLGKLFQSYTSMQKEKSMMMTNISKMLYDKTKESQEGAVFSLLDDMADQQTKDLCLVYTQLMLMPSQRATISELNEKCENFLKENFGVRVDFCLKEKLKSLLPAEIIKQEEETLTAVELEEAKVLLAEKWKDQYKRFGTLDYSSSKSKSAFSGVSSALTLKSVTNLGKAATKVFTSAVSSTLTGYTFYTSNITLSVGIGASALTNRMRKLRSTIEAKQST